MKRNPIRVLIADDHPVLREGLRRLLVGSDIDVVAEAKDAYEAVQMAVAEQPDVAMLDLVMPAGGGLEATRQILRRCPSTRVMIVSGFVGNAEVTDALRVGAVAFIPKTAQYDEILAALRVAHEGTGRLAAVEATAVLRSERDKGLTRLTQREREVLALVAQGYSSGSAAAVLGVSWRTVDAHRQKIMNKLRIHTASGLTRFAIENGIA